jgi:tRNA threonylcarbamoyl adenosine modification protein (Sua5/YciO/YrdC/YwlC family)
MILSINSENPQMRLIKKVVEVLDAGGVIVYPTDTVYGIGCDLFSKKGIERIYDIKKRSKNQPFSFVCADLSDISKYATVSNYAYKAMKRLLPGPYTFILDASRLVPKILLPKRKTVGIRVPDNKICLSIVKELGRPILSTSATTEQGLHLNDPDKIEDLYGRRVDMVVDGGILGMEPSSVVSLIDEVPEIIRAGSGDLNVF